MPMSIHPLTLLMFALQVAATCSNLAQGLEQARSAPSRQCRYNRGNLGARTVLPSLLSRPCSSKLAFAGTGVTEVCGRVLDSYMGESQTTILVL